MRIWSIASLEALRYYLIIVPPRRGAALFFWRHPGLPGSRQPLLQASILALGRRYPSICYLPSRSGFAAPLVVDAFPDLRVALLLGAAPDFGAVLAAFAARLDADVFVVSRGAFLLPAAADFGAVPAAFAARLDADAFPVSRGVFLPAAAPDCGVLPAGLAVDIEALLDAGLGRSCDCVGASGITCLAEAGFEASDGCPIDPFAL